MNLKVESRAKVKQYSIDTLITEDIKTKSDIKVLDGFVPNKSFLCKHLIKERFFFHENNPPLIESM